MTDLQSDPILDRCAATLVRGGGQFHQIIEHMARFAAARPGTTDAALEATLNDLVGGILRAHLPGRFSAEQIAAATDVLDVAVTAVAEDLFLVDPDAVASGPRPQPLPRRRRRNAQRHSR